MQIKVYPNPINMQFTVETNSTDKQNIAMFDVNGKLLLTQTINDKTNIDVSNLNNGMYFIQLKTKENSYTQKIIVQH